MEHSAPAHLEKAKAFLQYKAASVALKRGKTALNWIFQSLTRLLPPVAVTATYSTFIRPSLWLFSVIWGRNRRQDVVSASLFRIGRLFSCTESEIRAGKLLIDPGHLQEELVGGRPHHRYRRVRHRLPAVDRALQKNARIGGGHAKK
jgi:hypothetical protein